MTARLSDATRRDLAEQSQRLAQRVAASGLYTHEPDEFALACNAYELLLDRLGVEEDRGSLTTAESRNVVRRVTLAGGDDAVLKVVGNTREPGEGEVLAAWRAHDLPCVEPLDWGYLSVAGAPGPSTAGYVLTRYVAGPTLSHGDDLAPADRARLACELVEFLRPFHDAGVSLARTRTWEQRLRLHLRWTLPPLAARGWAGPPGWEDRLSALATQGRCVLHGDPAGGNVLAPPSRGMLLLDPPGALRGIREADVAQVCSQVGQVDHVLDAVAAVCEQDRRLDPTAVAFLAGMNFVVWAGYATVQHDNPDVRSAKGERVSAVGRHLEVAAILLALGAGGA